MKGELLVGMSRQCSCRYAVLISGKETPHHAPSPGGSRRSNTETKWFARSAAPEIYCLFWLVLLGWLQLPNSTLWPRLIRRVPGFQNKILLITVTVSKGVDDMSIPLNLSSHKSWKISKSFWDVLKDSNSKSRSISNGALVYTIDV